MHDDAENAQADWRLTYLQDFLEACSENNPPAVIRAAKRLRKLLHHEERTPEMVREIIDQLFPLLDDSRVYVRQCAACILLDNKINSQSFMPFKLPVLVPMDGENVYRVWERRIDPEQHDREWQAFVAEHRRYLGEQGPGSYLD